MQTEIEKIQEIKASLIKGVIDKNSHYVKIRLSNEEMNLLRMMMEKDGWGNTSGFIRYQLFGMDSHSKYKKQLQTASSRSIAELLNRSMLKFHQDAIFLIIKYEMDLYLLKQQFKGKKEPLEKYRRWTVLLEEYEERLSQMCIEVLHRQYDILRPFGVVISDKVKNISNDAKKELLRNTPDEILEFYASANWINVDPSFLKEYGRRVKESLTKKFQ